MSCDIECGVQALVQCTPVSCHSFPVAVDFGLRTSKFEPGLASYIHGVLECSTTLYTVPVECS